MQIWLNLVLVVQLLAAVAMIGLVLIQHGKGADMGASFGSGASGSLFGATGSANFLSRSTAVCATLFFICTLAVSYLSNARAPQQDTGSVLDQVAPPAVPAKSPVPAANFIPGVSAAASAAPTPAASAAVVTAAPSSAAAASAAH
jgi:preprotein translocase subunit SecG